MPDKSVVLHSGGLDSTVLLYYLASLGHQVLPLAINYNQRHQKELQSATMIAAHMETKLQLVDLSSLQPLLAGSSQTDGEIEVPEGHYSDNNMRVTVVPNRNMILLSIATAYAISNKANIVAYAAHAGDHAQYPDCRAVFIAALENAIRFCDYNPPVLFAPFSERAKADVVSLGHSLKVPFELTWSCYKGQDVHCGKCGTCVERAEAFYLARVPDPTKYEDSTYWKAVTAGGNR